MQRITGIDPGQLPADFSMTEANINPNDASFVDIIHTETQSFGTIEATGHASFWVNGGHTQPMCGNLIGVCKSFKSI